MKLIIRYIFIAILFLSASVEADSLEDFGNTMAYFYLNPTYEEFLKFQSSAENFKSELGESKNGAGLLVAVMIASISEKYDFPISESEFGDKAKEILKGKSNIAIYIANDSKVDPSKLDIWWAKFFATGEDTYLEKIFIYAVMEMPKNDTNKLLVIGAAKWSFKANCHQHKKVLEFAKRKYESEPSTNQASKFLKECIESTQTVR